MALQRKQSILTERCIFEDKYFTYYDQFCSSCYIPHHIAPKFYSKDWGQVSEPDPLYMEHVRIQLMTPKEKRTWPETTNQWYGWFTTPFVGESRHDSRLHFPVAGDEEIKHLLRIDHDDNNTGYKKRQKKFN